MIKNCRAAFLCSCMGMAMIIPGSRSEAQELPEKQEGVSSDIVVTARKRVETLLEVPVVVNVIEQERIERLAITDFKDVARFVPGLSFGTNTSSTGTQVSLRGIGTSSADAGIDQSVSFNIDGMSIGQGLAFQSGLFDLASIQVLKGPQALFFGKGSPGGVIALRTADPTDDYEIVARAGYEFESREKRGELIVSGPLTSGLRVRLAARYSAAEGFFENRAIPLPGTGALTPRYDRAPRSRSLILRGTILANLAESFDARLKVNVVRDRRHNAEAAQLASCPDGLTPPGTIPYICPPSAPMAQI